MNFSTALFFCSIAAIYITLFPASQTFIQQGPSPLIGPITFPPAPPAPSMNQNGAIQAVAVNPSNPLNLYIGAASGGVWSTNDFGSSWTPLLDHQLDLSISAVVFDPTDSTYQTLAAGTGNTTSGAVPAPTPSGLYYTTNGGSAWMPLGTTTFNNNAISDIILQGSTILAGVNNGGFDGGLYRSTDTGTNFTQILKSPFFPFNQWPITSLQRGKTNNSYYAGISALDNYQNSAVYQSTDNGSTWNPVFTSSNTSYINSQAQTTIKVATGPLGSIALLIQQTPPLNPDLPLVIFLSLDSGSTWNPVTPSSDVLNNINANYQKSSIAIDANNPNIIYISGTTTPEFSGSSPGTVYRLTYIDPNTTKSDSLILGADGSSTHADTRMSVSLSSGDLIVSSDGGIAKRTNSSGKSKSTVSVWQGMNGQNLATLEPYGCAYDGNNLLILITSQDNGACVQNISNQPTFNQVFPGDGTVSLINDQTSSSTYYFTMYQEPYPYKIQFVNGVIQPYSQLILNTPVTPPFEHIEYQPNSMALNRKNAEWLALVYTDTNSNQNVGIAQDTGIGYPNVTLPGAPTPDFVLSLAYGTQDNLQSLATCQGDGLYFTQNALTPNSLNKLNSYSGAIPPAAVVFDERTYQRFFVTDGVSVYETKNAGGSFTGALPNVPTNISPINTLEFISNNGVNALLVGGYSTNPMLGTVASADCDTMGNLTNWGLFGLNLPNAYVETLAYNKKADLLLAGLWGRGAWTMFDVTSNFASATILQFGLADNDSTPDSSVLTNGNFASRPLVKSGTGTLTITGLASYTGGTTVNSGRLIVSSGSSVPGNVQVNGGVLAGSGTIVGTAIIANGATLSPGSSIGTLTLGGLDLNAGSQTNLELNPSVSSIIQVNGNAELGGTLNVFPDTGTYGANQRYNFLLTTGSMTGVFGGLTIPSGYIGSLSYGTNYAQLLLVVPSSIGAGLNLMGNRESVLNYLTQFSTVSDLQPILIDLALLSPSDLINALDSISPSRNGASIFFASQMAFAAGSVSTDRLSLGRILNRMIFSGTEERRRTAASIFSDEQEHMFAMATDVMCDTDQLVAFQRNMTPRQPGNKTRRQPAGKTKAMAANENFSFWGSGFGDFISQGGQSENPDISGTASGALIGFDYFAKEGTINASAGYVHTGFTESGHAGEGSSNGAVASLYGTCYIEKGYIELGLLGGYNSFSNERHVHLEGPTPFNATAESSHNVWQIMPHLSGGYDFIYNWGVIEPFASFDLVCNFQNEFREHGASPLDMMQNHNNSFMLRNEIGLNGYEMWQTGISDKVRTKATRKDKVGSIWILKESISYVNKAPFNTKMHSAVIIAPDAAPAGVPGSFTVQGYDKDLNLLSVSAEIFYKHKPSGFYLSATYLGEFFSSYVSNNIQGTLGVFF